MSDNSPEFQQAVSLMQNGQPLEAENLMRQQVQQAAQQHGQQSGHFAQACYELAAVLEGMDRSQEAAQCLSQAASVDIPDDYQVTRNRLTYLMEWGGLLVRMQELEQAEQVLRQSLQQRAVFYGQDHSGYAFGLEPLAVLQMRRGELEDALQLIEQTIDIFWKDGHPRVATAFPYRAMILKRLGREEPTFNDLDDLPDEILQDMVQQTVNVLDQEHASASQAVIDDLIHVTVERYGDQHNLVLRLQSYLAHVQRWIGPSEGRVESLERLTQSLIQQNRMKEATDALMGLADAHEALKDLSSAEAAYRKAVACAEQTGDLALQSNVLRNLGLFYDRRWIAPRRKPH